MPTRRRMLAALVVSSLALLSGCGTLTPDQMANADYGPEPTEYETTITTYMERRLFDPYSAVYRFGQPRKGYAYVNGTIWAPEFGWIVEAEINGKNRMGGYVGLQPYTFFFQWAEVQALESFVTWRYAQ